jgi:hypothetical protein
VRNKWRIRHHQQSPDSNDNLRRLHSCLSERDEAGKRRAQQFVVLVLILFTEAASSSRVSLLFAIFEDQRQHLMKFIYIFSSILMFLKE